MKKIWIGVITCVAALMTVFVKVYRDTHTFKRERTTFYSSKLQKGTELRIMQISDLHNHVFGLDNEALIVAAKEETVDMIVMTGDLIDRKTMSFQHVFSLVEQLQAIQPHIYFVTGNHEWGNAATNLFLHGLRQRNVTILDNTNTRIVKNGEKINLAGVADASTKNADIHAAFRDLNPDYYTILLSHSPGIVGIYDTIPADLILSGHTHGGQVRLPLIGAIASPDKGIFPKLEKGTYSLGSHQYLYIDSGLGTTRLPIRFLNQSQFSLITITSRTKE